MDLTSYAVILTAIFSTLQFIHQGGGGSGGNSYIHLQHTTSLCASMSLLTLTSSKPLPLSKSHKISLFFAILACAFILSASVPKNLWWLPHLSSIRPLFGIIQDLYLFYINTSFAEFQHPIRQFCQNAADQCKRWAHEICRGFMPTNMSSPSSAPANLNSERVTGI